MPITVLSCKNKNVSLREQNDAKVKLNEFKGWKICYNIQRFIVKIAKV